LIGERFFLATAVVGGFSLAGPALAEDPDGDSEFGVVIVGGIGSGSDYEGSDDYEIGPFAKAVLSWEGYYARITKSSLKLNVIAMENFDFGPTVSYGGGRDDGVEDDKVKLLREVDESLEVGFFAEYRIVNKADPGYEVSVGLDAAKDVNDGHDGMLVGASVDYQRPVMEGLTWSLGVSTTYADDNYMESYFTIDVDNASRSGLARFDAEGGFKDVGLSTSLSYDFTEHWSVTGMLAYTRLIGDAADSPVVEDRGSENQFSGGVAVGYAF
jgi:outer membrane protein